MVRRIMLEGYLRSIVSISIQQAVRLLYLRLYIYSLVLRLDSFRSDQLILLETHILARLESIVLRLSLDFGPISFRMLHDL